MRLFAISLFILFFSFSCSNTDSNDNFFRNDFTKEEKTILDNSFEIINNSYYCTFITIDNSGQPRARVMEPFLPEKDFTIWLGTNPRSRKVKQIKYNPKVTIHYFDKNTMGYVSLMGKAFLVNDDSIKSKKWKKAWEQFYKNKKDDYLLIKFIPEYLELININKGYTGDSITWQPHKVILRKQS